MTNASQYKKERDEAREAVATLAAELHRMGGYLRDSEARADTQTTRANQLYTTVCNLDRELTAAIHERNQNMEDYTAMLQLARERHGIIREARTGLADARAKNIKLNLEIGREQHANKELRDKIATDIDYLRRTHETAMQDLDRAWTASYARQGNEVNRLAQQLQYYNQIVQECEDLRQVNAANSGPVWTKRLHEAIRSGVLDVVTENTRLGGMLENARADRQAAWDETATLQRQKRALQSERDKARAEARALVAQLRITEAERDLARRQYFETVPNAW